MIDRLLIVFGGVIVSGVVLGATGVQSWSVTVSWLTVLMDAIVGSLHVRPAYWREGIGTRLLDHLFDAFRDRGWNSVCLAVLADNEGARLFYERYGFKIDEERTIDLAGPDGR